jgi:hypothetical protein
MLFDEHLRGEANHGRLLYALTMISLWWRRDSGGVSLEARTAG